MKSRQVLQHDIVRTQQHLCHARGAGLCLPAMQTALQGVRQHNHNRLRAHLHAIVNEPDAHAAVAFFFEQLYPVRWPVWRDAQCLRTYPRMCRVMPLAACEVLLLAVELDSLTHDIDLRVAQAGPDHDLRLAPLRVRQIRMLLALGRALIPVTRLPMMTLLLRCAGPVARRQGLGELHAFFSAGLAAFMALKDPGALLDRIEALAHGLTDLAARSQNDAGEVTGHS